MIGFVSAISAALAVIVLVVIATLLSFIDSLLPPVGLVKISEVKYRYIMEGYYVNDRFLEGVVREMEHLDLSARIVSYQPGCFYGFNAGERSMTEIPTFNHIMMGQYFDSSVAIEPIITYAQTDIINRCFIDINLSEIKS